MPIGGSYVRLLLLEGVAAFHAGDLAAARVHLQVRFLEKKRHIFVASVTERERASRRHCSSKRIAKALRDFKAEHAIPGLPEHADPVE